MEAIDKTPIQSGTLTMKKRSGVGGGIIDNIRRTFAQLMRSPDPLTSSSSAKSSASYTRKNMTLPRLPSGGSGDVVDEDGFTPSHIFMTERLVFPSATMCLETPEPVRAEAIRLDTLSGGLGERLPRTMREDHGHAFCPIPLETDTFCDFCNQPIWGLGWGPVCQRCAG